jgi:hypothetical protein
METTADTTTTRELDSRSSDDLDVVLLWEPGTDHVYVDVADRRTRERFRIRVDAADALEAFRHPYAFDDRRRRRRAAAAADRPGARRQTGRLPPSFPA